MDLCRACACFLQHGPEKSCPSVQAKKKAVQQQETAVRQQLPVESDWEEQPGPSTSNAEVPEEISARILRRIIIFAGVPTFLGILSLPVFYYLKVGIPCFLRQCGCVARLASVAGMHAFWSCSNANATVRSC